MKMKSSPECFDGNLSRIKSVIIVRKITNEADVRVKIQFNH